VTASSTATTDRTVTIVAPVVAADEGGMERVMSHVASGLLERGFAVRVIAYTCRVPAHPALRFIRVPGPRRPASLSFPWFALAGSLATLRHGRGRRLTQGAIVPLRADAVAAQFCTHAFVASQDAPRRRRDSLPYRVNEALDRRLNLAAERWVYGGRRAGLVIVPSAGVAEELRRFFPALAGRIRVVPNGVDPAEFRPDPAARAHVRGELGVGAAPVAAFVGGDWSRKGLTIALEGVAKAPPWHLMVVGDGDAEGYAARARALGAGGRVHFVGRQLRPARFLAAADAFVFPSGYEPFGLVVLEAGATGLPLVVTRTHGTAELVRDGENGRVVERKGDAFAAALAELAAASPERRAAMSARARELAAGYAWSRVADGYAEALVA
jgi:glycosyltransferase involved in cell wall biosynthesis